MSAAASGGAAAAASSSVDCSQQEELNYELIGVTVHTGAAESGHYYCFIRDRSYPQSDVWLVPSGSLKSIQVLFQCQLQIMRNACLKDEL